MQTKADENQFETLKPHCRCLIYLESCAGIMREYKFACPVCGQHIMADSSRSGSIMECPTCFQKIIAPQAPATNDSKLILSGTRVTERPKPSIALPKAILDKSGSPFGAIIWIAIVIGILASVFLFRGKIFKLFTTPPNVHGTNVNGRATNQH